MRSAQPIENSMEQNAHEGVWKKFSGLNLCMVDLPLGNKPQYPLYRTLDGSQRWSGRGITNFLRQGTKRSPMKNWKIVLKLVKASRIICGGKTENDYWYENVTFQQMQLIKPQVPTEMF